MWEKIETLLSLQYIAQNAKWEMKRKNSFLVIAPQKRLQCLPVTLNLFSSALPHYKALLRCVIECWAIAGEIQFDRLARRGLKMRTGVANRPPSDSNREVSSDILPCPISHVCAALNKFIVHRSFPIAYANVSMRIDPWKSRSLSCCS